MRHVFIGASLLVIALMVTFAAATILQGMAEKTTANAEPFVIDQIRPSTAATRTQQPAGRSLSLASRQRDVD